MSLQHFFLDDQVLGDQTDPEFDLRLSSDDLKHARVLRLQPGEHIAVVDAVSDYFECEIVDAKDGLRVRIAKREGAPEPGAQVILLQGLSKGDKMDEVIRHATELGTSAFVPLLCERSIVKLDAKKTAARTERWRSIAKSAAMQSGQRAVPEVSEPENVPSACKLLSGATCVLVCWEEAEGLGIRQALSDALSATNTQRPDAKVAVVVGPEGGLTQLEVDRFLSCNAQAKCVTLGQSILRTETAGVVAPALAIYELGGLQ